MITRMLTMSSGSFLSLNLWRATKTSALCVQLGKTHCQKVGFIRTFASEPFNINAIIKSNNDSKSLDGIKHSVPARALETGKKRRKKETVDVENEQSGPELDEVEEDFPDWFSVLLDISYDGSASADSEKFSLFKDFLEELEIRSLPSVSTVLKKTENRAQAAVLKKWKKEKTKELGGEEQFEKYQKETLTRGLSLHKSIELYLRGMRDVCVSEASAGYFESVRSVLEEVEGVGLLEEELAHPQMFYRGKLDCVAFYRGTPCLIEWKTATVLKPMLSNTYDQPMQVAAYLGALNQSGKLKRNNLPLITDALLVVTYNDGVPATVHHMSPKVCQRYWQRWQERVYKYWTTLYKQHNEQ